MCKKSVRCLDCTDLKPDIATIHMARMISTHTNPRTRRAPCFVRCFRCDIAAPPGSFGIICAIGCQGRARYTSSVASPFVRIGAARYPSCFEYVLATARPTLAPDMLVVLKTYSLVLYPHS